VDTAIVSLIVIAAVLAGTLTITHSYLSSQEAILASWREMEQRTDERARTRISPVAAQAISADTVEMALRNEGEPKLADFEQWDVIAQYYDATGGCLVKWLSYTQGLPGNDEWRVEGIYLDASQATAEVYEPGILNPDEEMVIQMKLFPALGTNTTNWATIATPNGISASTVFTRGGS